MRNFAALFVTIQLLTGCQATSGTTDGNVGKDTALHDPMVAASIAADLTSDVSPFLAQGSTLALKPGKRDALTQALVGSLTRHGYKMNEDHPAKTDAIVLDLWSAEMDGDLLVRLSTPSHRLSRVYKTGEPSNSVSTSGSQTNGAATPAGPLLVEMVGSGASS